MGSQRQDLTINVPTCWVTGHPSNFNLLLLLLLVHKNTKLCMSKQNKKSKNKPHKGQKRKEQPSGDSGFLSKIPGLIKDVASIGSIVSGFMGTPMGAQTGKYGKLSRVPASTLISAPATTGLMSRTPNWDIRKAPDVGYGPGIRISGRLTLGEFSAGITFAGSTAGLRYFGLAPSTGSIGSDGTVQLTAAPLSFVVLSPVSGFDGLGTAGNTELGAFGNSDNIIQQMATNYQRYNVVDATVIYSPSCGTSDEHTLVMSWVPDPGIILNQATVPVGGSGTHPPVLADFNYAMSIPDSVTTPAWAPATFVLPLDKRNKRELLYVNDILVSPDGPSDPDAQANGLEARQLFEGIYFYWIWCRFCKSRPIDYIYFGYCIS